MAFTTIHLFGVFETQSLQSSGSPGTLYVDQAGHELKEIGQSPAQSAKIKDKSLYAQLFLSKLVSSILFLIRVCFLAPFQNATSQDTGTSLPLSFVLWCCTNEFSW